MGDGHHHPQACLSLARKSMSKKAEGCASCRVCPRFLGPPVACGQVGSGWLGRQGLKYPTFLIFTATICKNLVLYISAVATLQQEVNQIQTIW